jgi:hypothetical protein
MRWEVALLAVAPIAVIFAVELVHAAPEARAVPAEQGRYAVPAVVPVAAAAVAWLAALARERAVALGAAAVVLMAGLSVHGRLVYLAGAYF